MIENLTFNQQNIMQYIETAPQELVVRLKRLTFEDLFILNFMQTYKESECNYNDIIKEIPVVYPSSPFNVLDSIHKLIKIGLVSEYPKDKNLFYKFNGWDIFTEEKRESRNIEEF